MNRYQRLVLTVAALGIIVVAWTTPRVHIVENGAVIEAVPGNSLAEVIDVRTAVVRITSVLGGAGLLWLAARDLEQGDQ